MDSDGSILVADYSNHRLQKFTADGQFLAATAVDISSLITPWTAINPGNDKVYVVENRVQEGLFSS